MKISVSKSSESESSVSDESGLEENIIKDEELFKEELPEILDLDKAIVEFKVAKEYKFIYLVYAVSKKSRYFSPYNFKIVPYKNIKENCFFTLSNKGMMSHIQNDVRFTPFTKFEEDYRYYQKIERVSCL